MLISKGPHKINSFWNFTITHWRTSTWDDRARAWLWIAWSCL